MDIHIDNLIQDFIPEVASLWHDGWIDGHAAVVPVALSKLRTLDSFQSCAKDNLEICRAAISQDQLLGFTMVKADEVYQMYVGAAARGRGVAQL
ncbi:hypothetical protein [Planktotalea sp.]|uniref:hypothetical protein n=1 Tax=Planktotalea sp. TaxID=2029877 RepID=UPI003F6B6640